MDIKLEKAVRFPEKVSPFVIMREGQPYFVAVSGRAIYNIEAKKVYDGRCIDSSFSNVVLTGGRMFVKTKRGLVDFLTGETMSDIRHHVASHFEGEDYVSVGKGQFVAADGSQISFSAQDICDKLIVLPEMIVARGAIDHKKFFDKQGNIAAQFPCAVEDYLIPIIEGGKTNYLALEEYQRKRLFRFPDAELYMDLESTILGGAFYLGRTFILTLGGQFKDLTKGIDYFPVDDKLHLFSVGEEVCAVNYNYSHGNRTTPKQIFYHFGKQLGKIEMPLRVRPLARGRTGMVLDEPEGRNLYRIALEN